MPIIESHDLGGDLGTLEILSRVEDETEVREGQTYHFRILGSGRTELPQLEPSELFTLDPESSTTGQFKPRQHVGTLAVTVRFDDGASGSASVRVHPTKLAYETEYRAMLEQIADRAAEAVLQGFAPATIEVGVDPSRKVELDYTAIAFLAARVRDPGFLAAVDLIRARPHRSWRTEEEMRSPGRGLPIGSVATRAMSRAGAAQPCPSHLTHLPIRVIPDRVGVTRSMSTFDTPANRFVRHAFARWEGMAQDLIKAIKSDASIGRGPRARGLEECEFIVDYCTSVLAMAPLREAGRLDMMPAGSQVQLRRPGYSQVLRTFALAEASMGLHAVLPDDPFSATQRNVATLYEYWCFITLVAAVEEVVGVAPSSPLFESTASGLSLVLRRHKDWCTQWTVDVSGRSLQIDLWFNRQFGKSSDSAEDGSWARSLRPDASLRIRPQTARPTGAVDPQLDVWVHFDAKYRIKRLTSDEPIEDDDGEDTDESIGEATSIARREDLLKMHAYRDAIRRSAGAYILYPGDSEETPLREFHELLPGLGAFPLRPADDGTAEGSASLRSFIRQVIEQTANQGSALERNQFWSGQRNRTSGPRLRPAEFLAVPPADASVLVGYVRDDQRPWIEAHGRYNVRAGDRHGAIAVDDDVLSAGLAVLWTGPPDSPSLIGVFHRPGPWQVTPGTDLVKGHYPGRAKDNTYLVTTIGDALVSAASAVTDTALARVLAGSAEPHKPFGTTWDQLSQN